MSRHGWLEWFAGNRSRRSAATKIERARQRSAKPMIEHLEDRTVPATVVDLTTPGGVGIVNGAIFEQGSTQPSGTGVIQSFLRIQSHGQTSVEQGYNTSVRPVQFDEKTDPNFTRSVQLSEFATVSIGGVNYRVILLDINQKQSSSPLSLDELRIYVSPSGTLNGYDPNTHQLAGLDPVYDLTAGGEANWVKLDAALSHGSGSSDMVLFVPENLLTLAGANPYVYLYSKFGVNDAADGGFEEWAPGHGPIAPPPTLSGFAYLDNNGNSVFDAPPDNGIGGIAITLSGMNDLGQFVTLTTTTAADGSYFFVGFRPGTYMITEGPPPVNFFQEVSNVGMVNGSADGFSAAPDTLTNIVVAAGQTGTNYNFGLTTNLG